MTKAFFDTAIRLTTIATLAGGFLWAVDSSLAQIMGGLSPFEAFTQIAAVLPS